MLTLSLFSLMPMFVTLFWAVLLLLDKKRNLPQGYLAIFLLVSFVNYLAHASFFLHEYRLFAFLDNLWVFTSLSGYPLYYYYLRLLTRDLKVQWRWIWILLPSFLLSLYSFVVYFLMSDQELYIFVHEFMYHEGQYSINLPLLVRLQILRTHVFKVIFAVQLVLVVVCGFRLITSYDRKLTHFYSNIQGRNLVSFKALLVGFLFASSVSILSGVIGKDYFIDKGPLLAIPSLLHSAFLYWVGYAGYKQRFTISDFNKDILLYKSQKQRKSHDMLTPETSTSAMSRMLENVMLSESLFAKPDLKISDLALRLNTNRSYISRALNNDLNMDFCSWVNHYRISHAKQLMGNDLQSTLSMEHIAEESGFSNITTFYRVFKKQTQMTPGDYQKALRDKSQA